MSPVKSWRVRPLAGRPLRGTIRVPGDKSISHRALMLRGMAGADSSSGITGILGSEDVASTRRVVDAAIRPAGQSVTAVGDCGNSGTTMRLLMGLLAARPGVDVTLDGDESLRRRPMERVARPLREMGASIETTSGKPPVRVRGQRLEGQAITIDVASAQVKSAILLAGLQASGSTTVRMPAASRDHTERMLEYFGVRVEVADGGREVSVQGGARLTPQPVDVPGDISSAAFPIVAALLAAGSDVRIENVGVNPLRTGILDVLAEAGLSIPCENLRTEANEPRADLVLRAGRSNRLVIGGDDIPRLIDEIPVMALAAALADADESVVTGAGELRVKETDRIDSIASEFGALGLEVRPTAEGLVVPGRQSVTGGEVNSRGDHRIAMTGAVAGLISRDGVTVRDVACVETSFPGFVKLFQSLGAEIEEIA
jgi:3-phosphoshikimate 1-carboxyvinyltransferase